MVFCVFLFVCYCAQVLLLFCVFLVPNCQYFVFFVPNIWGLGSINLD